MSNSVQKIALITGGTRGIGLASAELLAKNGYDVCLNYLQNDEAAVAAQQRIVSLGQRCLLYKGDVSQETVVQSMFVAMDKELGTISALVNNAALMEKQIGIEQVTQARLNRMFSTNITSYFLCAKEAVLRMATKHGGVGGSIVNVSSLAAKTGSAHEYMDYAASKGAVDTLTFGLAKEMSRENIRVNLVRPAVIYTQMHADGGEAGRVDRIKDSLPLGRGGQPEEVAKAIYWFISDDSSFTTGDSINVSGGLN
ncbi:SDR family oxidoreductase [Gammaproteobacteria bacterium AS21]|jgi:NAD(P)-dependent dehydrogenase (short-subunit alcohol dehydrogenase family)